MKNLFCPRCKNSRVVGEHPYDHTWLTCYKCSYGFAYSDAVCPEFDEVKPEESAEKILDWAKAQVEFGSSPYWRLSWPVGFIELSWSDKSDEVYARIEAAMFIYLFCTGVPTTLGTHLNCAYAHSLKEEREAWEKKQTLAGKNIC